VTDDVFCDTCNILQLVGYFCLVEAILSVLVEKQNAARRNQLLQGPTPGEPPAPLQSGYPHAVDHGRGSVKIREEGVAHLRASVPLEHGVDGLSEFRTARFVDAAGINPRVFVALLGRNLAGLADLRPPLFLSEARVAGHIGKGNFLLFPRVGEDRVLRDFATDELLEEVG